MNEYVVAVVGAGVVGREMIGILRARQFPAKEVRVLARSDREMVVAGETYQVRTAAPEQFEGVDIALFAGTEGEKGAAVTFAAEANRRGAVVIDNGSDFRMDPRVPLVVPEVNAADLERHAGIIANPNCSTAQLVHALKPLHDLSPLTRVIVSTYQSVSGAGGAAVRELEAQERALVNGEPLPPYEAIPAQLAGNVLANGWGFSEDGYQGEEWKMILESRKILGLPSLAVTATTVRVPVAVGHAESVYVETESKITADQARAAMAAFPGLRVMDDPAPTESDPHHRTCPSPLDAVGIDDTLVGRVREDPTVENGLLFWVVADNLRKGAALNAVQIAEELIKRDLLGVGK